MEQCIKNIQQGQVLNLLAEMEYMPGQVVSKTLAQNSHHSLTLFAFDKDEEISTHASDGDAMVIVLDGACRITIEDHVFIAQVGETIVMPAKKPHALFAEEQFKMLLIVIFPAE